MIVLGIVLIVVGYVVPISIVATIGWVLLVLGLVLLVLGRSGTWGPRNGIF